MAERRPLTALRRPRQKLFRQVLKLYRSRENTELTVSGSKMSFATLAVKKKNFNRKGAKDTIFTPFMLYYSVLVFALLSRLCLITFPRFPRKSSINS